MHWTQLRDAGGRLRCATLPKHLMSDAFFEQPILNSPYRPPSRHWELNDDGQPTQKILETRRPARFITPIPKARKRAKSADEQQSIVFDEGKSLSTSEQAYEATSQYINDLRQHVDAWRSEGYPGVTPETGRLLQHWRNPDALGRRPFFCQLEAVETVIWLTEVAPSLGTSSAKGKAARVFLDRLKSASEEANPGLVSRDLQSPAVGGHPLSRGWGGSSFGRLGFHFA